MRKHTKIYCKYFGIGEQDFPLCEWCENAAAVDINHIDPRGMGGSKDKDYIENLVGMCRKCHNEFEAKRIGKDELRQKHLNFMNNGQAGT